jgi:hypothetical protein
MEYSINSRKLNQEVTFFTGNGTSYVFVDLNGQSGTLGNQICAGGSLGGSTITCKDKQPEIFKKVCDRWWKQYLAKERA